MYMYACDLPSNQAEQSRMQAAEEARAAQARREDAVRHARTLQRQHKAQMLQRAREIQQSLASDLRCVLCTTSAQVCLS